MAASTKRLSRRRSVIQIDPQFQRRSTSPPSRKNREKGGAPFGHLLAWFFHLLRGSLLSWHYMLQRRLALFLRLGMGQRFARQHLVAHRSVVYEDRLDGSRLREIVWLQAFVQIHVGVMRARSVIQRVLNELEARNPDGVKCLVIRASSISHRNRGDAQIIERLHPLPEDIRDAGVLLQVDASNLPASVIDVE